MRRRLLLGLTQTALLGAVVLGTGVRGEAVLRQDDELTLHDRVPGLTGQTRPTMAVVPGHGAACERRLARFRARAGTPEGIPAWAAVVVVTDPDAVRALRLGAALSACRPGYALLDGRGLVRYRTEDPAYDDHGQEQTILLEALR